MENFNFWIQAIISVLSGLAVVIPLVFKVFNSAKQLTKEKNWPAMLKIVMDLMADAEDNFEIGADRKEWVLSQLLTMSESINYDIDLNAISEMIDQLCNMADKVNI